MSALSQKRTLEPIQSMSALPPKPDIAECGENIRFVHKSGYRARLERDRFYQGIEAVLFKDRLRCLGLQERKISHRIRFGICS